MLFRSGEGKQGAPRRFRDAEGASDPYARICGPRSGADIGRRILYHWQQGRAHLSRGSRQRDRRRQRGNHARPCGSAIVRRKEMNEMTRSWPAEAETLLDDLVALRRAIRSEEHTSELQSLMRISYAVFCLKKKT